MHLREGQSFYKKRFGLHSARARTDKSFFIKHFVLHANVHSPSCIIL